MKVRINNNQPTAAQRKVLRQECASEFKKLLGMYNRQVALQILYILHFDYGFGQKRLDTFADKLKLMQNSTAERYEIIDDDVPDICEIKLKEAGIDLTELLKEE